MIHVQDNDELAFDLAHTIDEIVTQLDVAKGRPSVLINGIIQAPAFQRQRPATDRSDAKRP